MVTEIDVFQKLDQLCVSELAEMPIAEFAELNRQVDAIRETLKCYEQMLHSVSNSRFSERARQLREAEGKTTGTVRFDEDGFIVIADLPKRPEYDQAKLRAAVEALRKWGEDPEDYVTLEIKVSETKFNSWPPALRELFEPARTLKVGKPTYKLERIAACDTNAAANDGDFGGVA